MAGFNIHLSAIWANIIGAKSSFSVTSKRRLKGNFLSLVVPQIAYVFAVSIGIVFAILREGFTASFMSNLAWAVLNTMIFAEFISAALPREAVQPAQTLEKAVTT